jgi:hypothetical protein
MYAASSVQVLETRSYRVGGKGGKLKLKKIMQLSPNPAALGQCSKESVFWTIALELQS